MNRWDESIRAMELRLQDHLKVKLVSIFNKNEWMRQVNDINGWTEWDEMNDLNERIR